MSLRADIAEREMQIAFPHHLAAEMMPLLISEQAEFEALFGAPIRFVERPMGDGPRWLVNENAASAANSLQWDPDSLTLTSTIRDSSGLGATLQMAHSLESLGVSRLDDAPQDDLPPAIARISIEAERGYPGFGIRGLNWAQIRSEFPTDNTMQLADVQRMIARLQDGHTAVREQVPVHNPPYAVELNGDQAILRRVPAWSAASAAGIGPGWRLQMDDIHGWRARTGSPLHSHALVAGRRAIALNGIDEKTFVATSPEGEERSWREVAQPFALDQLLQHHVVASSTVYVRLHNWIEGVGVTPRFDEIVAANTHRQTMVLDLRGNTGGNLLMAKAMRRRFLRKRTLMGTIQFIRGNGTLAEPVEIWDDPAESGRWPGDLVVLTDALTYSASEDFLHGLQGLPHVTVIGAPSGGGSGRPRTLPLIPGWIVSMSTALTFDRNGHCIEGQGVPVDNASDPFTEAWRQHLHLPTP